MREIGSDISFNFQEKDAKHYHKRFSICSAFLVHIRTGAFLQHIIADSRISSFEVLTYRWGIASLILAIAGIILGEQFRISRKDWQTVFILSLFRATTSFSLVIAYQNIASGVASTIHFMYPLAVASP
mgnify:CR=1 FL=1